MIDPLGVEFSEIFPGIRKAIVEGTKGGGYAVGKASTAIADIALHGHPLIRTPSGVPFVSEAVPMLGTGFHFAYPIARTLVIIPAPSSQEIENLAYGFL